MRRSAFFTVAENPSLFTVSRNSPRCALSKKLAHLARWHALPYLGNASYCRAWRVAHMPTSEQPLTYQCGHPPHILGQNLRKRAKNTEICIWCHPYATQSAKRSPLVAPNTLKRLAIPARFERTTYRLGICCSILLSYGTI